MNGIVFNGRDITKRKRLEDEIQKVRKLESVGVLAGGIAHDFNNLLTVILGNISLAKMSLTDEKVTELLTKSEEACIRARNLTQRLLTFSKGGEPIKETGSVSETIKDTAELVLSGSNVRCEFSLPKDLWLVEFDSGQISQIIRNLVLNADEAMPSGGIIQIQELLLRKSDFVDQISDGITYHENPRSSTEELGKAYNRVYN